MSETESLDSFPPTKPLELEKGLTLVPRVKLNFTIYPNPATAAMAMSKPINEWKLKLALLDFFKSSLTVPITVPEDDLQIQRLGDLKKRKRDDPVAQGSLAIRDLGFLSKTRINNEEEEEEDVKVLEEKYLDWRKYLLEKMDGLDLNLEGVKYKLNVAVPASDDFEAMKKAWEDFYAFRNRGYSRGGKQEPDTIIMRGVPSRWFAEPLVSSKPSMLVTHSIFSRLGNIRDLNVSEDNDLGKEAEETKSVVSGLNCKIVVQFEKHSDFYNALKVLCGRSLQKQGARLKADYEVTWDKDIFFRNSRSNTQDRTSRMPEMAVGNYRSEAPRRQQQNTRFSPDDARRKRFKD
ncbi:hypothetical protein ACB098_10G155800 [Castanea mollissima]|uniref:A-kinase anchor protein 17A n=1 Tax=Castanea mollissima TaxID=60419 RepID=A0A8J4VAD8_9ROSI|nr:hypothetical protein CMV_029949 [Castanea mollissima]